MIFLDASVLIASEDRDDGSMADALALLETGLTQTLDLAIYEVSNVCDRGWQQPDTARRLRAAIEAMESVGNLVRVDSELMDRAARFVLDYGITAYDAAYVAASKRVGAQLVSCDIQDLVSNGLAVTPSTMLDQLRDEAYRPTGG